MKKQLLIGQVLRVLRAKYKWTLRDASHAFNINKDRLYRIEEGLTPLYAHELIYLDNKFNDDGILKQFLMIHHDELIYPIMEFKMKLSEKNRIEGERIIKFGEL